MKTESQHQLGAQKEVLYDSVNNKAAEWLVASAVDDIYDLFD
jgi:hypothetical protein